MLQIRLKRDPSAEISGASRPSPVETVTVACPDHLVLADLPVAKGIGSVTAASVVKTVGRRSRRQLGERVHFCVRCDFPIAVYGRLSPCEHAFCLECARSDSICYLCDERVQKIQTIKMMEGIFICAAPHCLKSFMNKAGFESHIHENHSHLLHPNMERDDGNDSDNKQSSASESTLRGPSRPGFSPGSGVQQQLPPRHMMPQLKGQSGYGQVQNYPAESQADNSRPPGFDQPTPPMNPFPGYPPVNPMHPPNFAVTMNQNHLGPPPAYNFPPYQTDGSQPFYNAHYEMPRPEGGSEQGSLLGFPPGLAAANPNFPGNYASQTWNPGMGGMSFDSQGNNNLGGGNNIDSRGGRSVTTSQPLQAPPPPPLAPPHVSQQHMNRGQFYSGDMGGRDVQNHGWQHENRDGYGGSQD